MLGGWGMVCKLLNSLFFSPAVFLVYYTVHGVLQERATEILVLCVAIFVVLLYLIINYAAGRKDTVNLVSPEPIYKTGFSDKTCKETNQKNVSF